MPVYLKAPSSYSVCLEVTVVCLSFSGVQDAISAFSNVSVTMLSSYDPCPYVVFPLSATMMIVSCKKNFHTIATLLVSHSTIGKGWRVYKCTLISRIAQKAHTPSRSFYKKEELTSRQNKRVARARLQIVAARRRSPGIAKICEPALVLRHIILYAPRGLRYGCC